MAVTVKTGGTFIKTDGQRPGLYVRFIQKAIAAIGIGARAKVATVKFKFTGGTSAVDKIYRVTNMEQANGLFGEANTKDIQNILLGGATEVIVHTTAAADVASFTTVLQSLETYEFHIFVSEPGLGVGFDVAINTWLKESKDEGKNFVVVYGDKLLEGDITATTAKATALKDEYAVLVANGVYDFEGNKVEADLYASYIAGLIAGTSLNGSITYDEVPFADVITRFRSSEVKSLLTAGVVVTVMDGDQPKIEQGLTLGDVDTQEFNKIRTVRAKQAMIDDINKAVNDSYIGKITNSPDGQIAVINAIKTYLQTLADSNVVATDFDVQLDKTQVSSGPELYINIAVRFLDSIEYVYLTITV